MSVSQRRTWPCWLTASKPATIRPAIRLSLGRGEEAVERRRRWRGGGGGEKGS